MDILFSLYEKKKQSIHVKSSVTQNKGRKRGAKKCEMKRDLARSKSTPMKHHSQSMRRVCDVLFILKPEKN